MWRQCRGDAKTRPFDHRDLAQDGESARGLLMDFQVGGPDPVGLGFRRAEAEQEKRGPNGNPGHSANAAHIHYFDDGSSLVASWAAAVSSTFTS